MQYSIEIQSEYYQLIYKSVTWSGCPAAQWLQSLYCVYLQTLLLRNRLEDGGFTTADIWADHNKHSMVWFIEKAMRFRFKFSDFDLYINILTIFKFQKGRLSFTMTQAKLPGLIVIYPTVASVQESSATLSILTISGTTAVLFASIFVELNKNPWCRWTKTSDRNEHAIFHFPHILF